LSSRNRKVRKLTPKQLLRYRRIAEEADRELASRGGRERVRRMGLRRLARLGPVRFAFDVEVREGGRLLGRVPGLPIRVAGKSLAAVREKLARRLEELASSDPFTILKAIDDRRRETLTVDFKAVQQAQALSSP